MRWRLTAKDDNECRTSRGRAKRRPLVADVIAYTSLSAVCLLYTYSVLRHFAWLKKILMCCAVTCAVSVVERLTYWILLVSTFRMVAELRF